MHGRQPYGYKTGILGVVRLGVGFDSCGIFYIGSRAYVCLYVYLSVCLSVCLSRCCLARVEEEGAKLIRLPRREQWVLPNFAYVRVGDVAVPRLIGGSKMSGSWTTVARYARRRGK